MQLPRDARPSGTSSLKTPALRELDRFIAASDERIQKKQNLKAHQGQPEMEEANRKSAETSMARSLTAALEPELLAILKPRYEGSPTGERGRIYFGAEEKTFYIICDPFFKDGDVQAGWFGIIRQGAHEQLTMLHFQSDSFQDDLLQAIRHAR
ncbi:MAG TPA: hypothetical protein VKU42_03250 [Candidatus Angelobacter sp.]|nr:hypothetical protein [Candidatus Angelobacter sp.]